MHDNRFGGNVASAVGKTWKPWYSNGSPPIRRWIHVTAVFRQNGESYVFLDGVKSNRSVVATNNEGLNDLWVGRPIHGGHWTDSWIKEVKVFDFALSDEQVKEQVDQFQNDIAPKAVAQVDFANENAASNSPFSLKNGAQLLPAPAGVSKALRINKDGPYALVPGVNIGPAQMPECTLTVGLYLESIANNRGWVFGHEQSGYDRSIVMHDNRFGGNVASAVGKTWQPWYSNGSPPIRRWIHVTAVFRQNGESYVFLDGVKSNRSVVATNNEGLGDLWVGRPIHGGHWTDSWIKEVKVFDFALSDEQVKEQVDQFQNGTN